MNFLVSCPSDVSYRCFVLGLASTTGEERGLLVVDEEDPLTLRFRADCIAGLIGVLNRCSSLLTVTGVMETVEEWIIVVRRVEESRSDGGSEMTV